MKKIVLFALAAFFPLSVFSQNSCANAVVLTPGTYNYGMITGTVVGAPNNCWQNTGTAAQWYSYTPATDVLLRVNTNIAANPASGDSRISVYTGTCANLVCYAGSDDVSDTNYLTDLSFFAFEGITYYITFDNRWEEDADNLSFEFTVTEPECSDALPFLEEWTPMPNFLCWNIENVGGDNLTWSYNGANDFNGDGSPNPVALVFPTQANNAPKNDWIISGSFPFEAGTTYYVSVKYNGFNNPVNANESMRVVMLDEASSTATFNEEIGAVSGIVQNGTTVASLLPSATTSVFEFNPAVSGDYHVGIHANTAQAGGILILFSVEVSDVLSTKNFVDNGFTLYPNPVNDIFTLSTDETLMHSVTISDVNGRIVKNVYLNDVSTAQVNISDLTRGVYIITVRTTNGLSTSKVVKN